MRCAIYTRVSTDEQAQPEYSSLQLQAELCQHYIQVHREEGWAVGGVYEDAGLSGKDLKRPALQSLLGEVRRGQVDVVVTYKLDRLSRSLKDFYVVWEVLQRHDVTFVSATQAFDTSTPAGNLMLNVLLSFAQYERELTAERTAAKMKARAQKGLWNGGYVPFGYSYEPALHQLRPHPVDSVTVSTIFDLLANRRKPSEVCSHLREAGVRTKQRTITGPEGKPTVVGGRHFRTDIISRMVANPVYKGFIACQGELYPGLHEPLIPEETWEEANRLLADNRRPRQAGQGVNGRDEHVHLLKGILRCGHCGSTMTPYPSGNKNPVTGQPYLYYACTAIIHGSKDVDCPLRSLPARKIEAAVKQSLSEAAHTPGLLEGLVAQRTKQVKANLTDLRKAQRALQSELEPVDQQLARLVKLFREDDDIPEALKEECLLLDRQREGLRAELRDLGNEVDSLEQQAPNAALIRRQLVELGMKLERADLPEQKLLLQASLTRITVNRWQPKAKQAPKTAGACEVQIRKK